MEHALCHSCVLVCVLLSFWVTHMWAFLCNTYVCHFKWHSCVIVCDTYVCHSVWPISVSFGVTHWCVIMWYNNVPLCGTHVCHLVWHICVHSVWHIGVACYVPHLCSTPVWHFGCHIYVSLCLTHWGVIFVWIIYVSFGVILWHTCVLFSVTHMCVTNCDISLCYYVEA